MSPKAPTAPGCSESELICLVGFCHPNCHGGGRHRAPTFPPLKLSSPWLCGFYLSSQRGLSGGLERADAFAGMPSSSCPQMPRAQTSKILHCLAGGRWGGCSNQPHAQIWILLLFSPFRKGVRERRRRRETPLKNVSCAIRSAVHLAAEPSDTPMARFLATRQLFSLL